jgi:putative aminopeptidase FrvX
MKGTESGENVLFVATTSEEIGGEGALFALRSLVQPPTVCVALEIGPSTPDTRLAIDATPTLWISDSYATMSPLDIALVYAAGGEVKCGVQPQAVTRGGSDATLAASRGFCARPVTLAFAAENSHGFEIMHRDATQTLADILIAYLKYLEKDGSETEE